jgi:hypothetical protein
MSWWPIYKKLLQQRPLSCYDRPLYCRISRQQQSQRVLHWHCIVDQSEAQRYCIVLVHTTLGSRACIHVAVTANAIFLAFSPPPSSAVSQSVSQSVSPCVCIEVTPAISPILHSSVYMSANCYACMYVCYMCTTYSIGVEMDQCSIKYMALCSSSRASSYSQG